MGSEEFSRGDGTFFKKPRVSQNRVSTPEGPPWSLRGPAPPTLLSTSTARERVPGAQCLQLLLLPQSQQQLSGSHHKLQLRHLRGNYARHRLSGSFVSEQGSSHLNTGPDPC